MNIIHLGKRSVVLALLLLFLTIGVALAQGEQLGGKLVTGGNVTISADETIDHDLYVFGGSLVSNGTIQGDLVVAGGNVVITGAVNGDVIAAGGQISIGGPVAGDIRVAGGQIAVAGSVSEDVMAAGSSISLSGDIGQDLIAYGGTLELSGSVAGSTVGSVGVYSKTGTVAGSDGVTITQQGGAPSVPSPFLPTPENLLLGAVRQFVVVVLVGLLALWLVPRALGTAEAHVRERPLLSFGWGVVASVGYVVLVIVIVLVAVLLAILFGLLGFGTLVAIDVFSAFVAVAGATLAFIVAAAFLADAIVGFALARLVAVRAGWLPTATGTPTATGLRWSDLGPLAAGVLVVVVLTSLPIVGWLVKLVVVLFGLGAIWLTLRQPRPTTAGAQGVQAPVPPAPAG